MSLLMPSVLDQLDYGLLLFNFNKHHVDYPLLGYPLIEALPRLGIWYRGALYVKFELRVSLYGSTCMLLSTGLYMTSQWSEMFGFPYGLRAANLMLHPVSAYSDLISCITYV